jgi:hypothetical protein
MDELLDITSFDPSTERDLFGPLPDSHIVKFFRRTQPDKRPPKPIEPGLSPGILVAPRAA